jgi:DNA-binding NarL/FixJ family response regulator
MKSSWLSSGYAASFIKVSIADDHTMVVDSLSSKINESGIAQVIDKYYNLDSCRKGLAKSLPDVLLLDIEFPDGSGVDFCAEMMETYPQLKIIMLTGFSEFNIAKHALHNGALGYILKSAALEEMLTGIETVNDGRQFLCKDIANLLKDKAGTAVIFLTNIEKTVLNYIAKGHTIKDIASLMYKSESAVKNYRKNLFIKLNVDNMAALVQKRNEMKLTGV